MKTLILLTTIIASLFLATPAIGETLSQEITITIPPVVESFEMSEGYQEDFSDILVSKSIAVRSNTDWDLDLNVYNYGFKYSPDCQTVGAEGLSNADAKVGDNYQAIHIICQQDKSWSDYDNAFVSVNYSIGPDISY